MMDDSNNQEIQDDFYYNYDEYNDKSDEVVLNNNDNNKGGIKKVIFILFVIILLLASAFIVMKLLNKNKNETISIIVPSAIDLFVGETKALDARVSGINNISNVVLNYQSENEMIATVTSDGLVTAIGDGSTNILITFYDEKNNLYKNNCLISVTKKVENNVEKPSDNSSNDKQGPTIKYTLPASSNGWYKGNVVISISATDTSGIKSVKYALDCTSDCKYTDITNSNKIAITGSGTKKIKIVAIDKKGNTSQKDVTINLDNTKPVAKLSISNKIAYSNTGTVEVCATCTDTGSGCKEAKVCQTHTQNIENVSLIVYDKAGNSTTTEAYKVVIDKSKPTCSLTYSDKKITATASDTGGSGLLYYGFNEKYTGSSTKEQTVDNKTGTYKYYVKDKAGNTNVCSLTCSFGSWLKSGYKAPGTCIPYSKSTAEKAGATWARECNSDGTVKQEWTRFFNCN